MQTGIPSHANFHGRSFISVFEMEADASSLQYATDSRQYAMKSRVHSIHLSNLLSPSPPPLPDAFTYRSKSGIRSASGAQRLALDLAVLPAILRISLDQRLDPAASVRVRVGFEVVYLTTAVFATVLDLIHRIVLEVLRTSGDLDLWLKN